MLHGNPAWYRIQSLGANVSTGGTHKSCFTTDVEETRTGRARKRKNDSQWTEKRAERTKGAPGSPQRGKQSADHVGDGRRSVAREPETEVLSYGNSQYHGSGETDSQSQKLRLRSSSFFLLFVFLLVVVVSVAASIGGTIGPTWMPQSVVLLVPLHPRRFASLRAPSLFRCSLFLSFIRVN